MIISKMESLRKNVRICSCKGKVVFYYCVNLFCLKHPMYFESLDVIMSISKQGLLYYWNRSFES